MKARGKFEGVFEYEDKKLKHHFVLVDKARPNWLGRDILSLIVIDWTHFLKARLVNVVNAVLNNLCPKYWEVFSPGLGAMEGVEGRINVDKGGETNCS